MQKRYRNKEKIVLFSKNLIVEWWWKQTRKPTPASRGVSIDIFKIYYNIHEAEALITS